MTERTALSTLQAENARLIALLESHGIEWRAPQSAIVVAREPEPSRLSTAEKVALFRWTGQSSVDTQSPLCA